MRTQCSFLPQSAFMQLFKLYTTYEIGHVIPPLHTETLDSVPQPEDILD